MDVIISQKLRFQHDGWSAAYCPNCDGVQAARLEQVIRVTYAYVIPVDREPIGRAARCDFCEGAVEGLLSIYELTPEEWTQAQGMPALLARLGVIDRSAASPNSERCLAALLDSANEQSSSANIDVTSGVVLGGLIGALIGVAFGFAFWGSLGPHTPLDQFGFVAAGVLGGILLGCVLGAMAVAFVMPTHFARKRLRRTVSAYGLDPLALQELAGRYRRPVRRAIRQLPESVRA